MHPLVLDALAILLPFTCAGCGADGRALCPACLLALSPAVGRRVLDDGTPVVSALRYDGVVRHAVLDFKENGRTDAAPALSRALATAIRGSASGTVSLVPMPVTRQAFRRRGYDPVRLLLRRARLGSPHELLVSVRGRGEQKSLDRAARAENLSGTFGVRRDIRGERVLLVDDVVTTGATLREAARAIRAAGGEVVGAAVLASTPLLFGASHDALGGNP